MIVLDPQVVREYRRERKFLGEGVVLHAPPSQEGSLYENNEICSTSLSCECINGYTEDKCVGSSICIAFATLASWLFPTPIQLESSPPTEMREHECYHLDIYLLHMIESVPAWYAGVEAFNCGPHITWKTKRQSPYSLDS
jgi:hypothetical protein